MGRVFSAYGTTLTEDPLFKYLVRSLSSSNNDWSAVEQNIWRAWGKLVQLEKLLGREGADRRTARRFYVTVLLAVILFGSKTWVLTSVCRNPLRFFTTGRYGGW